MDLEEWRSVPDFPYYEASSLGRVRSLPRTIMTERGRRVFRGKMLRPGRTPMGYSTVILSSEGVKNARITCTLLSAPLFTDPAQHPPIPWRTAMDLETTTPQTIFGGQRQARTTKTPFGMAVRGAVEAADGS